jgi:hypothetical protein
MKKEYHHDDKNKIYMHTQILNITALQYKNISRSILIIWQVFFPSERNNSHFTKFNLQKINQTPIMYTINIQL